MKTTTYEGWKNRATWNVSLWLNNDYGMYTSAISFMNNYKGNRPYIDFIRSIGMENERTGDNYKWLGSRLSYKELNEMMRELVK